MTRLATLDGLRGIAVMGILLMNIVSVALPEGAYANPAAYGSQGPADYTAWAIVSVLFDGKMRNLFSLLFGASMLLVVTRARAAGEGGALVHYRRMGWLFLFGALHLYLVWYGDILAHYALVGSIAFLFVDRPTGALVRLAVACFVAQLAIGGLIVADLGLLQSAASAPGAPAAAVRAWAGIRSAIGVPDASALAADLALHRGPWIGLVRDAVVHDLYSPAVLLVFGGAETLGLMLLGMAGLRSGFLTGAWARARYVAAMRWGYGLGLPLAVGLVLLDIAAGFDSLTVFAGWLVGGTAARPLVMIGHAALALLWLTGDGGAALKARVAAAGRAALTNYLATSLLLAALFYGWGLGLYGMMSRAQLYLIVPPIWAAMLWWSKPWLDRFAYGPLEWLWRSAARRRWQPLRKAIAKHSQ